MRTIGAVTCHQAGQARIVHADQYISDSSAQSRKQLGDTQMIFFDKKYFHIWMEVEVMTWTKCLSCLLKQTSQIMREQMRAPSWIC
jgi:hypothetical protein